MGTLSKALGGYGGFAACSVELRDWLINTARSFIYTTALPSPMIGSALAALDFLNKNPETGKMLLEKAERFRTRLQSAGLDTGLSESQIIPIIIGDTEKTVSFSRILCEKGLLAVPVRPPTVPQGTARLRLSVCLTHSEDDLIKAADIIVEIAGQEGII
jgi:7-keto-8-aminopelargonate synthetase-like enzyme